MELTDIKRTEADKKAEAKKYETLSTEEDYPWGLSVSLDDATIKKLKLGDLDAEEEVMLVGSGFVSEDSSNLVNGKKTRNIRIQLQKIAVTQPTRSDPASELYGDKK